MRAHPVERQLPLLQQPREVRAREIEDVGGFLRRDLTIRPEHAHGVSIREFGERFFQRDDRPRRNRHLASVHTDEDVCAGLTQRVTGCFSSGPCVSTSATASLPGRGIA